MIGAIRLTFKPEDAAATLQDANSAVQGFCGLPGYVQEARKAAARTQHLRVALYNPLKSLAIV